RPDRPVAFGRRTSRPEATPVAVVGDVTRDEVRSELLSRFGGWTTQAAPRPLIPPTPTSPPVGAREVRRDLTQATVSLARPGIKQDHPDYFSLTVANYILGGGSASRLYLTVRDERGVAYSGYSTLALCP